MASSRFKLKTAERTMGFNAPPPQPLIPVMILERRGAFEAPRHDVEAPKRLPTPRPPMPVSSPLITLTFRFHHFEAPPPPGRNAD
jgi:hypothetical protein